MSLSFSFFFYLSLKMNGSVILEDWIELYFNLTKASQRVRERFGDAVIDIPGHETILRPKETLQKLLFSLRS